MHDLSHQRNPLNLIVLVPCNPARSAQAFLKRHGSHTCMIDGANVALFGQNWKNGDTGERGGFRFAQIGAVLEAVRRERPRLKPLLVRAPPDWPLHE